MRDRIPYIRATVFDGLLQFVAHERMSVDVPMLMREHGLDPDTAFKTDVYVPLEPVSHFLERTAALTGRPCFGLDYAAFYPVGASGSLGYLLAHAPTMHDALQNLLTYIPAFTSLAHFELKDDEGGARYLEWIFPLEFTAAMPQYVSFALALVILRLRHIAGPKWVPMRVDLIHHELPCVEKYTALFGSRVRFEAAHNRMWLDPTTLAISHQASDARIYRTAKQAGDSEMQTLEAMRPRHGPDIVSQVRDHLIKVMADGALDLDSVAAGLGLDARRLQYMLEQARTTFSDQVSETRRLRATQLLSATDQPMSEIAAALGFAEMSSFSRACRESWFGMAPSKYRQRVRAEGMPPPKVATAAADDTGAV